MDETKKCPMCAEDIKAEAKVCRFCKSEFDVSRRGYCEACHKMVDAGEGDKCPECGAGLMDAAVHSEIKDKGKQAAATPVPAAAPPPAQPLPAPGATGEVVGVHGYQYALYLLMFLSALALFFTFGITIGRGANVEVRGGIGFPIIAFIVAVVGSSLERAPRFGKTTLKDRKDRAKKLKGGINAQGYFRAWRKGGLKAKIAALNILYAIAIALCIYDISFIRDHGATIQSGFYFLFGFCIAGFVFSLTLWSLFAGRVFLVDQNAEVTEAIAV